MTSERTTDKHGPVPDDAMKKDFESGTPVREAESIRRHHPTPEGTLSPDEIDARTELAQSIEGAVFPARPDALVHSATEMNASPSVLDTLRGLPDREYVNIQDIWTELGGPTEDRN